MMNSKGKILPLLFIFIIGLIVGGILIGEIARKQYQKKQRIEIAKDTTVTVLPPAPAGPEVSLSPLDRRSQVVLATEKVVPAIVSITITQIEVVRQPIWDFDFFGGFFKPDYRTRYREVQGIGSGVLFDTLGYILTNHHVIENAAKIMVNLPDGRQYAGELAGSDPVSDIAVVHIRGRGLPVAKLGSSQTLFLGETVIAMGNPFGYLMSDANPSVTTGVISALHRDFSPNPKQPEMLYQNMIQTDAAINPGNSGGALANILGEIIGINTFIVSPGGGSVGIGFAIPIDKAKKVASELIRYGKRLSYQTGIKVQDLTPAIAAGLGLDRETNGAVITAVEKPSPADLAGFRARDIIIGINNKTVHSTEDIQATFTEFFANDKVYLIILRGKQKLKIPLVLEPREEPKRRR